MIKRFLTISAALAAMSFLNANATLLNNGDFETGDLTGWSCTGADYCTTSTAAATGLYAMTGYDNSSFGTLSQTISTITGESYDFSFSSRAYSLDAGNILRYQLGTDAITTVTTTTAYATTFDSFIATGLTTSISFFFETDPGTATWLIDDVSVTGAVATPAPTVAALLALGLFGIGFSQKRRAS